MRIGYSADTFVVNKRKSARFSVGFFILDSEKFGFYDSKAFFIQSLVAAQLSTQ